MSGISTSERLEVLQQSKLPLGYKFLFWTTVALCWLGMVLCGIGGSKFQLRLEEAGAIAALPSWLHAVAYSNDAVLRAAGKPLAADGLATFRLFSYFFVLPLLLLQFALLIKSHATRGLTWRTGPLLAVAATITVATLYVLGFDNIFLCHRSADSGLTTCVQFGSGRRNPIAIVAIGFAPLLCFLPICAARLVEDGIARLKSP